MEQIRLQKYLAEAGIASRRKCEEYIVQGRVKVNNKIAELGRKIDPKKDKVLFDDKKIYIQEELIYILLNKPIGYVTTAKDQFNRDSVLDLVKTNKRLVFRGLVLFPSCHTQTDYFKLFYPCYRPR